MSKINILPKHIAELIAAGEVVERPASVIKELTENSFDAGAHNVTVEIKDGGITYIRVADDGCGIPREDVRNAFVSHATSKVCAAEDLTAIGTLGFRGEALACVAAVSRVELLTRTEAEDVGTRYCVTGGEAGEPCDAGCPVGTTIVVRDLFFNTPARMKFLKKDVSEGNAAASAVRCAALSRPEVSVKLIRDGKEVFFTPGDGDAHSAVRSVFGREFSETLIPAAASFEGISCEGLISRPEFSRQNRNMQFFFLNGRYIRTSTGSAALSEGFKGAVMTGKFPACVLYLTMPAGRVDVNVHPAKTEVRFDNDRPVFSAVLFCVRNALSGGVKRPRIGFTGAAADKSETAAYSKFLASTARAEQLSGAAKPSADFWQRASVPSPDAPRTQAVPPTPQEQNVPLFGRLRDTAPEPFGHPEGSLPLPGQNPAEPGEAPTYEGDETPIREAEAAPETATEAAPETAPPPAEAVIASVASARRVIGEVFHTYIIVEDGDALLFIDKHAAHERMIYNELTARGRSSSAQLMLIPVSVTLSHEEYSAAIENIDLLSDAGFIAEDFGSCSIIIRACPPELDASEVSAAVQELCAFLARAGRLTLPEKLESIYHTVACRAAIKAGTFTSRHELELFTDKLLTDPEVRHCPHGRPVAVEMTRAEMEKSFGRI